MARFGDDPAPIATKTLGFAAVGIVFAAKTLGFATARIGFVAKPLGFVAMESPVKAY